MTLRMAYNTTDSVLLVDESGYTIGGRRWGAVDTLDPIAKAELASDRLVPADEDALRAAPDAELAEALASLDARRERRARAEAMSKDELLEALPDGVVDALPVGGDDLPPKAALVEAVEYGAAAVPPTPETTAVAPADADESVETPTARKKTTSTTRSRTSGADNEEK